MIQFLSVILNNTSRELKDKVELYGGQGHMKVQVMNLKFSLKYCLHPDYICPRVKTTGNWILDPEC